MVPTSDQAIASKYPYGRTPDKDSQQVEHGRSNQQPVAGKNHDRHKCSKDSMVLTCLFTCIGD